ncbi:MAG: D-lyxose/D-mannose family sugar isomerase [Lentisphaerae bacterium GWF2_52_8]|nr:MAG: D-lyxose/D-mannose family sugar isomerase [Lentisphaerae bacterium GWF2_52_8]
MKRSEVNALINDALLFFAEHHFHLPPWALWSPSEWKGRGDECEEIRENMLGWDISDFGSGNFYKIGLLLFTLRNGKQTRERRSKTYAEKIMLVREGQVTPMHFHWNKMEDIINRGGGELVLKLFASDPADEKNLGNLAFTVSLDGVSRACKPGEIIRLSPGESITLEPYVYHSFWSEKGRTLVGEVSMVNDDASDNCFYEACGRFSSIEEDELAQFCLCNEYPRPA